MTVSTPEAPALPTLAETFNFVSEFLQAAQGTRLGIELWMAWRDDDGRDSLIESFLGLRRLYEQWIWRIPKEQFKRIHTEARHGRGPVPDWRGTPRVNAHEAAARSAVDFCKEIEGAISPTGQHGDQIQVTAREFPQRVKLDRPPCGRHSLRTKLHESALWLRGVFDRQRHAIRKILDRRPLPDLEVEIYSEWVEAERIQRHESPMD